MVWAKGKIRKGGRNLTGFGPETGALPRNGSGKLRNVLILRLKQNGYHDVDDNQY